MPSGPASEPPVPSPGDHVRARYEQLRRSRVARGELEPNAYERAFGLGSEGEQRFGTALNAEAGRRGGCWVLHGLIESGKRADIDHLVIGPAGVTVIDAKTWTGRVWIGRLGLGRGRKVFAEPINGMRRQINRVHSTLAKAGYDDVPVAGVICMVNENDGVPARGFAAVDGVRIGRPRAVMDLALGDGPVDGTKVEIVQRTLESAFQVRGGAQPPAERATARAVARVVAPLARSRRTAARRRVARALLGCALIASAVVVLATVGPRSVDVLTGQYRNFSRADLKAQLPEMKIVARRRAHGPLQGRKVIATQSLFVVTYHRGKRCHVRQTVSRAAPAFGGGKYSTVARGCRRR